MSNLIWATWYEPLFLSSLYPPATFNLGEFHVDFLNEFTPVVVDYIDTLEKSLQQELATSLPYETWLPVT